jgi:bleomycin hydrolase
MKRKSESKLLEKVSSKKTKIDSFSTNIISLDADFIKKCSEDFCKEDINLLAKNTITNVGSFYATTDHAEATKVSHVFLNSIKKKNLKATNQGMSGRCWIFSGLNVFRHHVIKALDLENFEFSETYLFFWDKFERSNSFLQGITNYFDNNIESDDFENDNLFKYLVETEKFMSDGGYWNNFANLVTKYGLIPKTAMPETCQSEYSTDMNEILMDILQSTANQIYKIMKKDMKNNKRVKNISKIIEKIQSDTLQRIYNTLVKFLGEPPKTFDWSYVNEAGETNIIQKLSPHNFKDMVIPGLDMNDFVVLTHIPDKKYHYYQKYSINFTNNVIEGNLCETINLPIDELKKYAKNSVIAGMPVWFAADVGKSFHPLYSCLNDKVFNNDVIFGKNEKMTKSERFLFKNQETSHAMTIVGVNIGHNHSTVNWEVENSWGYYDNEEPGKDGFLNMDDDWFTEYVGHIVVHKKFLSRNIQKILKKDAIRIEPWESIAPAILKINQNNFQQMRLRNLHKHI